METSRRRFYIYTKKVVLKHLGLEDVVENVLERMGAVDQILLVGDYSKGIDSGLIEVFLIGLNLDMVYITQLEKKIEKKYLAGSRRCLRRIYEKLRL